MDNSMIWWSEDELKRLSDEARKLKYDASNALWEYAKRLPLSREMFTKYFYGVLVTPEMFYDLWRGKK